MHDVGGQIAMNINSRRPTIADILYFITVIQKVYSELSNWLVEKKK